MIKFQVLLTTIAAVSSPKKHKVNDDDSFGQMIASKMSKIPEGEEKKSLKLDIQYMIKDVQFGRNSQPVIPHRQLYPDAGGVKVSSQSRKS